MSIDNYLDRCRRTYDSEVKMLAIPLGAGAGIHTRITPGTMVHPTRDSLQYALALLQSDSPADRAAGIIGRVMSLQDADPVSPTYGVWPYFLEEPLDKMNPPDWNWADFCGARIAQMLHDHAAALPDGLLETMRESMGHAAWSIFRRNVALEYTNIAIMGGGVAAAAGEMLEEPRLVDFARNRLGRIVGLAKYHDSFPEYNSPTYTIVALEEAERILHLCRDEGVRAAAEELRQTAWTMIAEHYHPGTQQWAGPNSRSYADHIRPTVAEYLFTRTGHAVQLHPSMTDSEPSGLPSLVPAIPCPERWRNRFIRLPEATFQIRRRFIRREDPGLPPKSGHPIPAHCYGDRCGTTWFDENAALGSVNHEDTWTQRRIVIAHIRTPDDPAVTLRLRFLHDGRDFASGFIRNAQEGPRVLSAVTFLTNRGDWHPYFDHPAENVFHAEDFRLRYEMTGSGALAERSGANAFALCAGEYRAVVHTTPGKFGDTDICWESGAEDNRAWVDAVCYRGSRRGFDFETLTPVRIAAGMELLAGAQTPAAEGVCIDDLGENRYRVTWAGLDLDVPMAADVFPE